MTESAYPMLPVEAALGLVLAQVPPRSAQSALCSDALGLITAAPVVAREPLPPFRAAVKDGYAVVAADGPGVYPVVGAATAGRMAPFLVTPGTVAYITTGAPLPNGADAVVMVEQTATDADGRVHILRAVKPGEDVRPVGYDVQVGQEVLPAGAYLGPAEIGLLATVGMHEVAVWPRPRVGILSTGDELVEPDDTPGPGQIRDSNRAMLAAAVTALGGVPVDFGIAGDKAVDIQARMAAALAASDIVLTSGGVSMGELDLIKPLLEGAGQVHFGRLNMKPGKPCTFATVERESFGHGQRRLVFGLPGNPVSSLVTFYLMVAPAIRRYLGCAEPQLPRIQVQITDTLRLDPERPEYHRATARWQADLHGGRGGFVAHSTGNQASSRLVSMRSANVLLELPQAAGTLAAGTTVSALVIGALDVYALDG